eukprot:11916071-Karenia_brevis.AAC.1
MFGNLEWQSVRQAVLEEAPPLAASTAWKHKEASYVEQPGCPPQVKNRGAEQGDTAGPMEAWAVQTCIARDTRTALHTAQRSGRLPWCRELLDESADLDRRLDDRTSAIAQWSTTAPLPRSRDVDTGVRKCNPANDIVLGGGVVDM